MFSEKYSRFLFIAGGLFVFVFLLLKALRLDITNDEAYSFYIMKHFWYAEALCTGNTHWLNSLAIKTSLLLGNESLLAIRWLSLLSGLIFIGTTLFLIKDTAGVVLQGLLFCLLLLNPYLLDYFCMARGYASGLMFELLAISLFYTSTVKQKARLRFPSLVFAGLAAISNYSFCYFFAAFSTLYFWKHYRPYGLLMLKQKTFYRDLLLVCGLVAAIGRALLFLHDCSNDYLGAGSRDFKETFAGLADGLIYTVQFSKTAYAWVAALCFLLISVSAIYGLFQSKKHPDSFYTLCSWLLAGVLTLILINRYVFDGVMPAYRSAIFMFPLTVICLAGFINALYQKIPALKPVAIIAGVLLFVNLCLKANLNSVFDYRFNADLKACFKYLNLIKAEKVGMCPEVYGGFRNYYSQLKKTEFTFSAQKINSDYSAGNDTANSLRKFDYLVLVPPYNMQFYKGNRVKLKGLKFFPQNSALVIKCEIAP